MSFEEVVNMEIVLITVMSLMLVAGFWLYCELIKNLQEQRTVLIEVCELALDQQKKISRLEKLLVMAGYGEALSKMVEQEILEAQNARRKTPPPAKGKPNLKALD